MPILRATPTRTSDFDLPAGSHHRARRATPSLSGCARFAFGEGFYAGISDENRAGAAHKRNSAEVAIPSGFDQEQRVPVRPSFSPLSQRKISARFSPASVRPR
jgi:hypothetical protein